MLQDKRIDIFCGTGGVGKTTLATARALSLALSGKRVLLITIDPAKRLKQVLGIDDHQSGAIHTVPINKLTQDHSDESQQSFDALLMSPMDTLKKIIPDHQEQAENPFKNPILNILARPNGGMNEILAIIEVQLQLETGKYDCIVLDTPPGKHFIDFLNSAQKIKQFFDKSFVEIFRALGKGADNAPARFIGKIISSGVKKLLSYLETVTGPGFVDTFLDAISFLYQHRDNFLKAIEFQDSLKDRNFSNWFLVTSVDQDKLTEAENFQQGAALFMHGDSYLAINKSLRKELEGWSPKNEQLIALKNSMTAKESRITEFAQTHFDKTLHFPEVLSTSPIGHVEELCRSWQKEVKRL